MVGADNQTTAQSPAPAAPWLHPRDGKVRSAGSTWNACQPAKALGAHEVLVLGGSDEKKGSLSKHCFPWCYVASCKEASPPTRDGPHLKRKGSARVLHPVRGMGERYKT